MKSESKLIYLRYVLLLVGIVFIFGLYPLMYLWPSGWRWEPHQVKYEQMIVGIYATLGIFLLIGAKNPLNNRSLIWFTVWSSAVHGTIMLLQAIQDPEEIVHLYGDIAVMYILAIVLAYLTPSKTDKQGKA